MLNQITFGTPTDKPPLLIAHGLFGSARNWGVIAKRLSEGRHVVAVDMRNHGKSEWFPTHTYDDLASDLAEVIAFHGGQMDVLGHSKGGKASMVLALLHPEKVARMVVADIAPTAYAHSQIHLIKAMESADLGQVERRADVAAQMGELDDSLKSFLLQSFGLKQKKWRLNLPTLASEMSAIVGFPAVPGRFEGDVLFLSGAQSDYVPRSARPKIKALFPNAKFAEIPGAGHWSHADKPREFEAAVRAYLNM